MRAMILAVLLATLTSCGLLSPDVEPAVSAIREAQQISDARLERELALCEKIADAEARAQWEAAFRRDATQTAAITDDLLGWVDAVGSLDWKQLYQDARTIAGER